MNILRLTRSITSEIQKILKSMVKQSDLDQPSAFGLRLPQDSILSSHVVRSNFLSTLSARSVGPPARTY